MQLKIQSLWPSAPIEGAALPAPDTPAGMREEIVTITATTLGVLVVALIAVLMGLVN